MNVNEVKAEADALFAQIEKAISEKRTAWSKLEVEHPGGRAFTGACDGMVVIVIDFDISDQGFPPGSRGHDGTATFNGLITRLPRELSKKFFEAALQSVA